MHAEVLLACHAEGLCDEPLLYFLPNLRGTFMAYKVIIFYIAVDLTIFALTCGSI